MTAGRSSSRAAKFWIAVFLAVELLVRVETALEEGWSGLLLSPPPPSPAMLAPPLPELGFVLSDADDRSGGYGPETAPIRILCIGNSNIYGHYIGPEKTFPFYLERSLAESGIGAHVVNAGVPGYTSTQIRANLEARLAKDSFHVVVFTAGWNDLHEAGSSDFLRRHAAPGPPSGWLARIGLVRLADRALEKIAPRLVTADTWSESRLDVVRVEVARIIRTARHHGARVYALDLPSGLSDDDGQAERGSAEKVVYPPLRRFTPTGYRKLFLSLVKRYRETVTGEGAPLLTSGLEFEVPWEEKKYLILDQCHPTPRGNRLIVDTLLRRFTDDGVIGAKLTTKTPRHQEEQ